MLSLCKAAQDLLRMHHNPRRAIEWSDPLPAESLAMMQRLREKYRHERTAR